VYETPKLIYVPNIPVYILFCLEKLKNARKFFVSCRRTYFPHAPFDFERSTTNYLGKIKKLLSFNSIFKKGKMCSHVFYLAP